MGAYGRQAKDIELMQYATEIKVRTERRCGELLRDSAARGERSTGGKPSNDATVTTLADIGLTRGARCQRPPQRPAPQAR